jgi:hypothetical protein
MIPDLRKLGVAPGQQVLLRHAPRAFGEELRAQLPPGARLAARSTREARYDLIFEWLAPDENLNVLFDQLQHRLTPNGALWVVIPNQRAAKARGVRYDWNAIVAAALKTTLVDNKTLSFSNEEYGTRFVIRKIHRESL